MGIGAILSLIGTGALCLLLVSRPVWGFLGLLAWYPFLLLIPRGDSPGVNAETFVFTLGLLVMVARSRPILPPRRVLAPIAVFYLVMLFSLVVVMTWYDPHRHGFTHLQLLRLFKASLWPSLVFFMSFAWIHEERTRQALLTAIVLGTSIVAASGIFGLYHGSFSDFGDRAYGLAMNPNVLGILVALCSVISLDRTLERERPVWSRVLHGLSYALFLIALILSQSRKSWIAVLIAHFGWLFFAHRRLLLPSAAAAVILFTIGFGLLPEIVRDRIDATLEPGAIIYRAGVSSQLESSAGARVVFYTIGGEMLLDSPLWGHGFHGFRLRATEYGAKYGLVRGNDPHSLPLKVAVESGLIGIASLLWVVWLVFRSGFRMHTREPPDRRMAELFLVVCLALGFVNLLATAMDSSLIAVYFWAFFGAVARAAFTETTGST